MTDYWLAAMLIADTTARSEAVMMDEWIPTPQFISPLGRSIST